MVSLYPKFALLVLLTLGNSVSWVNVATFGGEHTPPMADPDNYEDGYVLWVTSQDVKSNYLDRTTTQITDEAAH